MLILVPPSEGKTPPSDGAPVDLGQLAFPGLQPIRERVVEALEELSYGDQDQALRQLKLGPRSRSELVYNQTLRVAPAAPASEVYSGVLFDRLGLDTLSDGARERADQHLLIASALWGVVRPSDRIPAYRHPATARLPGLPTTKQIWRDALDGVLPADRLVVDMRSTPYREMWRSPSDAVAMVVNVVRESGRRRIVVSHDAKATRGEIARALLEDEQAWAGDDRPDEVAERVAAAGWRVELREADQFGVATLTIVESA